MKHEEAKFILQSYRPGGEDQDDPVFADALKASQKDPDLRAWHEAEIAFDQTFQEAIQSIEPPAELRTSILAGMRATAAHSPRPSPPQEASPDTTQRSFWTASRLLGVAAVLALVFTTGSLVQWIPQPAEPTGPSTEPITTAQAAAAPAQIPEFISFLTDNFSGTPAFEKRDDDFGQLVGYLKAHDAPVPTSQGAPGGLAELPTLGCLSLEFDGHPVSMICFVKDQGIVHLYTTQPGACPQLQRLNLPTEFHDRNRHYRVWNDGERLFILASERSGEVLREIF